METYELTQKILSFGPSYQVRANGSDQVLWTIKGKLLTATPKLTMVEGTDDGDVAFMKGNFVKTKFDISVAGQGLGALQFPLIALKKSFTLALGDKQFKADGGFLAGTFKCTNAQGEIVLQIAKQLSLKDKFQVSHEPSQIPREVALMAAVAIDQKFFEDHYASVD